MSEVQVEFVKSEVATTGVGATCRKLLLEGLSNAEVLVKLKELNPASKTTSACVAWYKSDLRKKNLLAPKGFINRYFMMVDGEKVECDKEGNAL